MSIVTFVVLPGIYLVASLNFSIVLLRLLGRGDPRLLGSRNPGTTNTARIAGRAVAAAVLLLDLVRAAGAQYIAASLCPAEVIPWAAFVLVLGNRLPIWHGFRGGKGVAALLGFVLPLDPALAAISCLAWLAVYGISRLPAAASMAMVLGLSLTMIHQMPVSATSVAGTILTATLIVLAHESNWKALRKSNRPPSS